MRIGVAVAVAGLLARGALAEASWVYREAAAEARAWHVRQAGLAADGAALAFRNEETGNGFLFPRAARLRSTASAEADISVRKRLADAGWSFAGVTLFDDAENYWMLALVEAPDGRRSVDFIENHAGVWQAQSAAKTALTRAGNVSFAWKSDTVYRVRLAFEEGKVTAHIGERDQGAVLGSASFALDGAPSVRSGRPGLIVHASAAECLRFRFGHRALPPAEGGAATVALLDDPLPGHDRGANGRLAEALSQRGFRVERLTAERLLAPAVLTAEAFPLLVVPQCDSVPALLGPAVQRYAREGGALIFLGGPFLDRALRKIGGRWLDKEGQLRLLQEVEPAHRPFAVSAALDVKGWRRACANTKTAATFRVVDEGPQNRPCLRLDIQDLQGWDIRHTPDLEALFGKGDAVFTFLAKGGPKTSQLAVEIQERDGSRWIATAPLEAEWRRVVLRLDAFRYWKDSGGAKGRGRPGDRLNPEQAVRVGFGLSASHTPAVGAGAHTFWLADVGTAADPLGGEERCDVTEGIETVYPRYKVHVLDPACRPDAAQTVLGKTVCAIPRTTGEGLGRGAKWRFLALAEARQKGGTGGGVCEWLLVDTSWPLEGSSVAGFGYTEPGVWSSAEVLGRIADAAERVTRGVVLDEAGTEQFAYWPGEAVRMGACVRVFGGQDAEREVVLEVRRDGRVVKRERVFKRFAHGVSERVELSWQPPAEPGVYRFTARLGEEDLISHEFAVLDPKPAEKESHISAKGGDFWLRGEKWYPVGVNYWPLYVSGMEPRDYSQGWLRDAFYAPALVERDLAQMSGMGINLVSIQTPPAGETRNLLDFLRLCSKYGMRANLYVGLASPLAFKEAELKAYLESARLPGHAAVFAYDTIWEPGNHVFKDEAARAKWDPAWRAWIGERYGSLARAEADWGYQARRDAAGRAVSPPDAHFREDGPWRVMMAAYRRFMDNLTSQLWGRAHRRLRELDPNHLISFRQGNTLPYDFALSGPVRHIDFICPEGYAIHDTDEGEDAIGFITRYADFTTGGKPIVWSEFGKSVWDNSRMEPDAAAVERQGRYSLRFYRTALAAGANGTVPWWWVGGYRVDEASDFGIVEPGRAERPAAGLIRTYGPRFKKPREKPVPDVWFDFDRDAHAGGYWRASFNEGASAYRAATAAGNVLGVRSPGTGKDSVNVPLVAVGNVPCDGTNPPKYLDAEIDALQVLNADGVWQEAEDGAVITVPAGQPVRLTAQAGNTQEAAWVAGSGAGCVMLTARADGREPVRWPLKNGVAYLQSAMFRDLQWPPLPEGQTLKVSVRLEAVGRTPFGEARVFTLSAKAP